METDPNGNPDDLANETDVLIPHGSVSGELNGSGISDSVAVLEEGRSLLPDESAYSIPDQLEMEVKGPYYNESVSKMCRGQLSDRLWWDDYDDWPSCLLSCFFPPLLVYQIIERLPTKYRQEVLLCPCAFHCVTDPAITFLVYALLGTGLIGVGSFNPLAVYITFRLDRAVALHYGIERPWNEFVWNILFAVFCQVCTLAQLARHTGRAQGFIRRSEVL
jgi:hypothetical protein